MNSLGSHTGNKHLIQRCFNEISRDVNETRTFETKTETETKVLETETGLETNIPGNIIG